MKLFMVRFAAAFLLAVVSGPFLKGTTVRIRVTDIAAQGLPKILVIVWRLGDKPREVLRDLTRPDGVAPSLDVSPGSYYAIATDPHGPHFTQSREFVVQEAPVGVEFHLTGETVVDTVDGRVDLVVTVLDQSGQPASGAEVLASDLGARVDDRSVTDARGRATVKFPAGGSKVTVLYKGDAEIKDFVIEDAQHNCCPKCFVDWAEKLHTTPHNLTVRMP